MKLPSCLIFCLLFIFVSQCYADYVNVYELDSQTLGSEERRLLTKDDALLYLSDKIGISDYYKIGNEDLSDEFIGLMNTQKEDEGACQKPKLIVLTEGVFKFAETFESRARGIRIKHSGDFENLRHILYSKFPKQVSQLSKSTIISLTNELKLISSNESGPVTSHFKYFNEQLVGIWESFKKHGLFKIHEGGKDNTPELQHVEKVSRRLDLVNDKAFMNELAQLVHINKTQLSSEDVIFARLHSPFSIGNKIGFSSVTYESSLSALATILRSLTPNFDIIVVAFPPDYKSPQLIHAMEKRNQELSKVFNDDARNKRGTSFGSSCFSSEEACQVATFNCYSHGVCSKFRSNCWSCLCSSSYNKTTSKTTNWAGYDCSKKDISAEANLFLWTTLASLVLFIGGIQLLLKVGNEPLPGVLDAATASKKNP